MATPVKNTPKGTPVRQNDSSGARKPARKAAPPAGRETGKTSPAVRQNPKSARRRAVRWVSFKTLRKRPEDRKPFPLGMICILGLITVLLLFMMMNYAEIDRYNGEIRDLNNQLAELKTEQAKLNNRLDARDDFDAYRAFAEENLGMIKDTNEPDQIITPDFADRTEIAERDASVEEEGGVGYLLSGLAEVLRGFLPQGE